MSDSYKNFEFILKKNTSKQPIGLYSGNKQQNNTNIKPQDVISSVAKQLKAIQVADSLKSDRNPTKDLQKYKKSNFLSVNNLPVYEEVPKTATKFDTQCVSDTQLINIIEDAEIIDVHRGMTQEFETTFCHHTEKPSLEDDEEIDANISKKDTEKENLLTVDNNEKVTKDIQAKTSKETAEIEKESKHEIHVNIAKAKSINRIENNIEVDDSVNVISPIMCSNNIVDKETGSQVTKNDVNKQIEDYSQLFHDCIQTEDDIEIDKSIERPLSPIFMHKTVKTKSKTPSPLIFNLENFEQFEKIAIPLLESNDLKTAKQVINSQILDKELCFKISEEIVLNEREILQSLVLQNTDEKEGHSSKMEFKTHKVKDPDLSTDLEFIDIDKATSEDLINKVMNEDCKTSKVRAESEILKDEILFSSDEEDNYLVHKSYQDLPFTCALETSFYDQPDVLDKTMYVGFQTASNKSIQIFTESFAQAKTILSGELTVTDLVNNCDNSVKNKPDVEDEGQTKMDLVDEETEFNLAQKEVKQSELALESNIDQKLDTFDNFEGFMTASNKVIRLSQKALARCKKVFQDIDLSDNFDTQVEEDNIEKQIEVDRDKIPGISINHNRDIEIGEDIQNIDDDILQEFENIEMSLKEDKEPGKIVPNIEFKPVSNQSKEISDTEKIKEVIKDIDFDEDLAGINTEEIKMKESVRPTVMEGPKSIKIGFKTASNKDINISKEALEKTKNIFQDLGATDFPNKSSTSLDKEYPDINDLEEPSTDKADFVGFKTANNKNINISKKAFAKVSNIFKDIDNIELPNKNNKEIQGETTDEIGLNHPSTSAMSFVGFKTANNKAINISKDALAKTKKIFQDIDSTDFQLPTKQNTDAKEIYPEKSDNFTDINQPSTSKSTFVGFKTASNRNVKISEAALAKTKNIFKDLDSEDFKYPEKGKETEFKRINVLETSTPTFKGFKTANNKEIKISTSALAKTKNVFEDLDADDFKYPEKLKNKNNNAETRESDDDKTTHGDQMIDFNKPSTSKASFAGFMTANNKKINITKEALAKTKNIFKDIDAAEFKFPEKGDKSNKSSKDLLIIDDEHFLLEVKDHHTTSKAKFMGFKTANNRNINISEESLAKTKNIFKDIDATDFKFPEKRNEGVKDVLKTNAEDIIQEIEDFNQPSTSKGGFIGFKTANNKNIVILKESLAKTRNIFKDIDATDFNFPDKVIKYSKEAEINKDMNLEVKGKTSFESEMIDFNQPSTSKASFGGFKTANNKKISISKESLAKTKNIFKDIDSNDFSNTKNTDSDIQDTVKKGKSPYPDSKETVQLRVNKTSFIGFKTANNKVINVSETALSKTRSIFKDIDSTDFKIPEKVKDDYPDIEIEDKEAKSDIDTGPRTTKNDNFRIPESKFQGFQTASNKQVKVSAEALAKSRKIFQDIDVIQGSNDKNKENGVLDAEKDQKELNDDIKESNTDDLIVDGKSSPIFRGFQTANKKPVKISEEALAKSRKLFQDIETLKDDPEPEFHGFKTGRNEEVEVSQNTLAETKKLFEDVIRKSGFQGFQTASDKNVDISEDALAKSRKIFQDVDENDAILQKKTSNIKFGSKTGSHQDLAVSEEAVTRSKRKYSEIHKSLENITINKKDKVTDDSIANIIDTQVLNNFDESLHTEDFHDTPIKSKRSGSPILSCPRAKKRKKFETPYSQKLPAKTKKKEIAKTGHNTNNFTFTENYKKNKKYTLKDLEELTRKNSRKLDPYLLKFTMENLLQFEFNEHRNEISNSVLTIESLKTKFLNSVNAKLVPKGWLENHLKLILWKLISYEIKFKFLYVTVKNVIDQLKYRYDKELYNAQRPALRKILEKDDVASKTLVLCVAGVFVDGVSVASAPSTNNIELLLTDGWYCIKATIDKMLAQLVCQGKIVVGSKIVTNGAELVNCEQGISPWEDTSAVRLKISGNSTRRARWDARLGYHGNGAMLTQLSSVKLDGGKVSKLRVFVTRVYPALYVEKFEDGSTVTRSERLEHLHQMKTEAERQAIMEKIYEEVEKEFSDEESQDSEGLSELTNKRTCLDSGSQIAKVMKRSKDPAEFRAGLTSSQARLLESHTTKHREHLLQNIQQKIRQKIEKAGVCVNRNVVTLLKIRVAGVRSSGEVTKGSKTGKFILRDTSSFIVSAVFWWLPLLILDLRSYSGMMSIWKPPEAVLEIIKEGAWIDVMNVVPTAVRYSEIQISAGRQSVFSTSKYKEPETIKPYTKVLKRICFTIKDLTNNPSMATDYNEIDSVGFIFLIDPDNRDFDSTKQPFQNVFLADADKNIICVNFWGGLKKFGYQNVLDTGQIVYGANLQKRAGNTRKSIPQFRVTEFSYFTKMPKNENARLLIDDLSKKFLSLDRRKFIEDCVVLKNNYAVIKNNTENISPYRFNNSDFNMSKNKVFIDSPLARPSKLEDFNLTGLDFESTFKQIDTQLSEEMLQRKRKVNEKIARLKMYGEPPPLSTIHIINRSKNASNSYKSPLNSNNSNSKILPQKSKSECVTSKSDSSVNVASVKESPEKCGNSNDSDVACSPVLMNRTFVKSVNPVKINFDMKDNNDSNVDHFAEEFDGSPPLSLD